MAVLIIFLRLISTCIVGRCKCRDIVASTPLTLIRLVLILIDEDCYDILLDIGMPVIHRNNRFNWLDTLVILNTISMLTFSIVA